MLASEMLHHQVKEHFLVLVSKSIVFPYSLVPNIIQIWSLALSYIIYPNSPKCLSYQIFVTLVAMTLEMVCWPSLFGRFHKPTSNPCQLVSAYTFLLWTENISIFFKIEYQPLFMLFSISLLIASQTRLLYFSDQL